MTVKKFESIQANIPLCLRSSQIIRGLIPLARGRLLINKQASLDASKIPKDSNPSDLFDQESDVLCSTYQPPVRYD